MAPALDYDWPERSGLPGLVSERLRGTEAWSAEVLSYRGWECGCRIHVRHIGLREHLELLSPADWTAVSGMSGIVSSPDS